MRDLAILTFITLDGVMQGPSSPQEDPSDGFTAGGWAAPYWDGVMEQVRAEAMAAPYDILFGRKTYELFANHWPKHGETPEGAMLTRAQKWVVTSADRDLTWENTTALVGDPAATVRALKQTDGPLLQVHGSWQLIQTLLAHGLIDEFRLWTFPVVAGAGKRLFAGGADASLRLVKTAASGNGAVMSTYRRA